MAYHRPPTRPHPESSKQALMENEAITATVRDYFEGWFDGDRRAWTARSIPTWSSDVRAGLRFTTKERMLELTPAGRRQGGWRRPHARYPDRGRARGHRQRHRALSRVPRVRPPRSDARRLEDRERALGADVTEPRAEDLGASGRRGGAPRRRRAAARRGRLRRHHDAPARRGGRRQPRPRPLLLRLEREPARAGARALHRAADRAPARPVRGRRPVPREVAHRDALPRRARTSATRRSGSSCRRWPGTDPELRERLARVNAEWRAVLTDAFAEPHRELEHRACRSTRWSRS